jgi:hypothetical protein
MSRNTKFLVIAGAVAGATAGIAFDVPGAFIAIGFYIGGVAVGLISTHLREASK